MAPEETAVNGGKSSRPCEQPLRISHTLGGNAGRFEILIAAALHIAIWGGGMVLGPLSLLGAPFSFFVLSRKYAAVFAGTVATLCLMPKLPESPLFCRLFLRTTALLRKGSTLWVADHVAGDLSEGTMVCYHPHGVVPLGFSFNGAVRAKTRDPRYTHRDVPISHRVSGVQAPVLFKIPILRQVLELFGCTMPATKQGMYKLFKANMTFGIIVGGSEDVALQVRGRERIFLKHRAGFLKYAMQFGYKVIVAYNFGESDLYENVSLVRPLNMWLVKNFGFVLPIFWGRWWCPLLPRGDVELNTVYGEVLQLPLIENPTPEQVAEWHGRYMDAVEKLFERHKHQFGFGDRRLEIL